jgi:hypothetical protein
MGAQLPADIAIAQVAGRLKELPVFITGSSVAAAKYDNIDSTAYSDVDIFCATQHSLIAATQRLLNGGFKLDSRFSRVWARWLKYGFKGWHTNSIRLTGQGVDVNLVFKIVDGHPTTSLAQVIESFDFGLLAIGGFDCEQRVWRDMRGYLFPNNIHPQDLEEGRLPFMPNKREAWRNGFISQYVGLREFGRYVKYTDYGYDMRYVKDDLVTGYWSVAEYLNERTDRPEKVQLGMIFQNISMHIEKDDYDKLRVAAKEIVFEDDLDAIMDALS